MHVLSLVFGNASVAFMFKSIENAQKVYDALNAPIPMDQLPLTNPAHIGINVEDDYGQKATIKLGSFHGMILEDTSQTALAHAEQMVHRARVQNQAQKLANADPALRMVNSPAVLNPMGAMNGRIG